MKVTKERMDELLAGLKQVAKGNRERAGFSGNFVPVAIVVGPEGEHSIQPIPFKDRREKQVIMTALSIAARQMHVLAIVLVTDTYHLNSKKFAKYYGLDPDMKYEEFNKAYMEKLNDEYEGSLANAPQELVSDALCICMKGPIFKETVIFIPYHEGVGDSIRWDEEEEQDMRSEILMLEDWWDAPTIH